MSGTHVQKQDILFNITEASIGRCALVPETFTEGNVSQHVAIVRLCAPEIRGFVHLSLIPPFFQRLIDEVQVGVSREGLSMQRLRLFPMLLPPLAEQPRIVAKVDELMALCDQLEAAKTEREQSRDRLVTASLHRLNSPVDTAETDVPDLPAQQADTFRDHARFVFNHLPRPTARPEHIKQLRQTILNLAVHGKLVPQDPNDEPAVQLLKRIQAEKVEHVKDGKAKIGAQLPPVDCTEAPFDLPPGWAWARFSEVGTLGRGKSKHRPRNDPVLFEGGTHLFIQTGDVARSKGIIETFTGKYNEVGLAQSAKWPKGTLCITIAANIADSGILSFDSCFPDSVVGFIPVSMFPNARYFEYFIRTAKADLLECAPATAQKNINLEILNAILIPLPPLVEQYRIVEGGTADKDAQPQPHDIDTDVAFAALDFLAASLATLAALFGRLHRLTIDPRSPGGWLLRGRLWFADLGAQCLPPLLPRARVSPLRKVVIDGALG
jgi:type I restriction enzyme S subunit